MDGRSLGFALRAAADFGATIAVPAVAAVFIGAKLDRMWGTTPLMLALCLLVAFVLTGVILVRKAKRYAEEMQNQNGQTRGSAPTQKAKRL